MKYLFCLLLFLGNHVCHAQQFKVSYPAQTFNKNFSGHVLLFFSKKHPVPKDRISWPCFAKVVSNIKPGQAVVFDDNAIAFPLPLSATEPGEYYVQAVFDRDLGGRSIGSSPGNLFSTPQKISIAAGKKEVFTLTCDQVIPEKTFVESVFVKEMKVHSALLSRFHKKDISIDAPVILPAEYWTEPGRKFPVLFTIAGYASDYHHYSKSESSDTMPANPIDSIPCIRIYLDGSFRLGHTCYANSANNGPWGDAFVEEFLPALQKQFRCNGAFLLRGHSSGGWTALWLQTHYPEVFAGCNASAPDPVDFRRFVQTNLYTDSVQVEDANALTTGWIVFNKDSLLQEQIRHRNIENVIYRGEQSTSFNAVFSAKGKDGLPEQLIDYKTGRINKQVLEYWKPYDISRYLQANWGRLQPDLKNKIRVSVGNEDNAFLNVSVQLLETEMKKLHAEMVFAYYPGTHFTVTTPQYKKDELTWLKDKYVEWLSSRNELRVKQSNTTAQFF